MKHSFKLSKQLKGCWRFAIVELSTDPNELEVDRYDYFIAAAKRGIELVKKTLESDINFVVSDIIWNEVDTTCDDVSWAAAMAAWQIILGQDNRPLKLKDPIFDFGLDKSMSIRYPPLDAINKYRKACNEKRS